MPIQDYLIGIGLDSIKDRIKSAAEMQQIKHRLNDYIESQWKVNELCSLEEELDFQGICEYIRNELLDDINLCFFGEIDVRQNARESILNKAVAYSLARTALSQQRARYLVAESLDILYAFYREKINRDLLFAVAEIENTIIANLDTQAATILDAVEKAENRIIEEFSNQRLMNSSDIQQTQDRILSESRILDVNHITHSILPTSRKTIGREREKQSLLNILDTNETYINVHGTLGIGKSTLCDIVLKEITLRNQQRVIYINARGCTTRELTISSICSSMGILIAGQVTEETVILRICATLNKIKSQIILYFDNFEDCLQDNTTLLFIKSLCEKCPTIKILTSSRHHIQGMYNFQLQCLEIDDCIRLFRSEAERNGVVTHYTWDDLGDFIQEQLDRHTLSILLVASHAYLYSGMPELVAVWTDNKNKLLSSNGLSITPLAISVLGAYQMISNDPMAIHIWSCMMFFKMEMSYCVFDKLYEDNKGDANDAVRKLIQYNLLSRTELGYYMLQPMRDQIFQFIRLDTTVIGDRDSFDIVADLYLNDYYEAKECFEDIAYALGILLKNDLWIGHEERIQNLVKKLLPAIKQNAFIAIELFDWIEKKLLSSCCISKNTLYYHKANMLHAVGRNHEALEYFDKIQFANTKCDDELKIKVFRNKCEIYRLFKLRSEALALAEETYLLALNNGEYNEAVSAMWQKSEIYRLIDKDLNRALSILLDVYNHPSFSFVPRYADVIWSIGTIYVEKKKYKRAHKYIKKAVKIYKKQDNQLGLAYALLSLSEVHIHMKGSNVLELYEQAEAIFDQNHFELGLAHVYQHIGKYYLSSDKEKALRYLKKAQQKYKEVGYVFGEKDTAKVISEIL